MPIYLVFHWIGQPTASVAAVAYIPKSAEIGKALGWAWTEGLNGEMKRGPRCGAYLLRESDYAHDRLVNYARDKHSEQAVDAAIQVLRSHASELTPVLSSAFLTITDEVIRMRAQLNANGVQSNSKNARQVPTYNVSISDQKLVDEAKRFLTQMKKQQSAKLDPSTPDEWGIREVRDWLKSKEGTNFETLGGRKEFAKAANEIVASIGCGFVCCKCENVFVSLAAANAGYSKGSFVMKHRVEKKLERHLSSIRFPALVFVPNLSNLIAKDLGR